MSNGKPQDSEIFEHYHSMRLNVISGSFAVPTATLEICCNQKSEPIRSVKMGNGPVDASFKAIMAATKTNYRLVNLSISSVSEGTDAVAECTVQLLAYGEVFKGLGSHEDIIVAASRAYIDSLNKIESWKLKQTEKVTVPLTKAV